jgi:hypothetical protein
MQNRLLIVTFEGVTEMLIVTFVTLSRAYSHKVPNIVLYHYYYIIIIIKIIYHNAGNQSQIHFSDFIITQCDT